MIVGLLSVGIGCWGAVAQADRSPGSRRAGGWAGVRPERSGRIFPAPTTLSPAPDAGGHFPRLLLDARLDHPYAVTSQAARTFSGHSPQDDH